eukprot:scaffold5551_cov159-Ochromonas_danica.AAC.23
MVSLQALVSSFVIFVFLGWLWLALRSTTSNSSDSCEDPLWCDIDMPSQSAFGFSAPSDKVLWRKAQRYAAEGVPVLLEHIMKVARHEANFVDGSLFFRDYHTISDYFLDDRRDWRGLSKTDKHLNSLRRDVNAPRNQYPWRAKVNNSVLPPLYELRNILRRPIVKIGYAAFAKEGLPTISSPFFMGDFVGEVVVSLQKFLTVWTAQKDLIDLPFIAMHIAHEHWGLLSTSFANRTIDWGVCCEGRVKAMLDDFLNHNKTVMLLVNQHSNISHPKIVHLPSGLPLHYTNYRKILWDSMLTRNKNHIPHDKFMLTSVPRNYQKTHMGLMSCLERQFSPGPFYVLADPKVKFRDSFHMFNYFNRLGGARISIVLPGPSYDSHRIWESLTIGCMIVMEKGVGLDKLSTNTNDAMSSQLWKLPALL